jgi:hypothetical protein
VSEADWALVGQILYSVLVVAVLAIVSFGPESKYLDESRWDRKD